MRGLAQCEREKLNELKRAAEYERGELGETLNSIQVYFGFIIKVIIVMILILKLLLWAI